MSNHCDHITDIFNGTIKGIPTLTVIGLLNNNFTGGEFVMFEDKIYELDAGDIIVFPSIFLYPHRVNPITSGTRYSVVSWVY
jgi:predicted 2-oxoglutarate/Fe(II)-dependent dioxygenase YbiX